MHLKLTFNVTQNTIHAYSLIFKKINKTDYKWDEKIKSTIFKIIMNSIYL